MCHSRGSCLSSRNEFWYCHLKKLWGCISKEGADYDTFVKRLAFAVVPIAILPFEKELYAKYISEGSLGEEPCIDKYIMHLIDSETEHTGYCGHLIVKAPGLYRALCAESPAAWVKYRRGDKRSASSDGEGGTLISEGFSEGVERPYFAAVWKNKGVDGSGERESDGHYVVPIYVGTAPLYVLVVLSERFTPDVFTRRLVSSALEELAHKVEAIVDLKFEGIWQSFALEVSRDEMFQNPGDQEELWKAFRGSGREFYSWIHCLPGHPVSEIGEMSKRMGELTDWVKKSASVWVQDGEKIAEFLDTFSDGASELFCKPHDFRGADCIGEFRRKISGSSSKWQEAKKLKWIKERIDSIERCGNNCTACPGSSSECIQKAYELKSVLNVRYDREGYRISIGLIKHWPKIVGLDCTIGVQLDSGVLKGSSNSDDIKSPAYQRNSSNSPYQLAHRFWDFLMAINAEGEGCFISYVKLVVNETTIALKVSVKGGRADDLLKKIEAGSGNVKEALEKLNEVTNACERLKTDGAKEKLINGPSCQPEGWVWKIKR